MDPGPKVRVVAVVITAAELCVTIWTRAILLQNLLEYLGLDWDMRSRILSQQCAAWDVIKKSEPEVTYVRSLALQTVHTEPPK